jgi:hypothetical protein
MATKEKLKYLSSKVCRELQQSIERNIERYLSGSFLDLAVDADWSINLTVDVDLSPLNALPGAIDNDAKGSVLVWQALGGLLPSLAIEGRIWTRLAHVECLEYSRARWIGQNKGETAAKIIGDHFFGNTRTACRDDNAIGRLWWTAYVAHLALPEDHEKAIAAIWRSADIRSNVIERPWISSRPKLAGAIVRAILEKPGVSKSEEAFREFMKTMNAKGGGMLFEVMTDGEVNSFVKSCIPGA